MELARALLVSETTDAEKLAVLADFSLVELVELRLNAIRLASLCADVIGRKVGA